jgi:micrococcal nuclease
MRTLILMATTIAVVAVAPTWSAPTDGRVVSWTDGDTLRVVIPAGIVRVRLIGIDDPEISRGDRAVRQGAQIGKDTTMVVRLGRQAKAAAERLAPSGSPVRIQLDVQTYDRFGRLLAYVYLRDGRMVNEELVRQGWAMVLTIPPNVRYVDRFLRAQRDAREHRRGLWSGFAPRQIAAGQFVNVRIPLPLLAGSGVFVATATLALLAAHTTWRTSWFVPAPSRLLRALGSLLLSTLPLLAAAALHTGRSGALLLLIVLAGALLLIHRWPLAGILGALVVAVGPWASVWPLSALRKDLGAFVFAVTADPTNVPFLLFVASMLIALGRVVVVRRRLHPLS